MMLLYTLDGMAGIRMWRDLKVWQKAHELVLLIYEITRSFPTEERFGLISQMRRASVSTPSNIVEGFHRQTVRDSLHFYNTAGGSLEELRYQCLLARDLGYITEEQYQHVESLAIEVGKMLGAWVASQRQNSRLA